MKAGLAVVIPLLLLAACDQGKKAQAPAAAPYDPGAVAHFCGMTLGEHPGPKGQIWVDGEKQPVWFTSVHDTIAFTLLPEEPKDLRAIYVTDMAKAPSWAQADKGGWIEARHAFYVIDSDATGGMGTPEAVPFSTRDSAESFAKTHGGRVVDFDGIPKDYILGAPAGGMKDMPGMSPGGGKP